MVGKFEQYYSFPSGTSIAPAKAEGGNELYGGGRQGAKAMEQEYEKPEPVEDKNELKNVIRSEFKKRKTTAGFEELGKSRSKALQMERQAKSSKVRSANNFKKIPKLKLEVREHSLKMLEDLLKANYADCVGSGNAMAEEVAVELEYQAFDSSKLPNAYRMKIHNKMMDIKLLTTNKHVFPIPEECSESLSKRTPMKDGDEDMATDTWSNTIVSSAFQTASQLINVNESEKGKDSSSESNTGDATTNEVNRKRKEENKPETVLRPSKKLKEINDDCDVETKNNGNVSDETSKDIFAKDPTVSHNPPNTGTVTITGVCTTSVTPAPVEKECIVLSDNEEQRRDFADSNDGCNSRHDISCNKKDNLKDKERETEKHRFLNGMDKHRSNIRAENHTVFAISPKTNDIAAEYKSRKTEKCKGFLSSSSSNDQKDISGTLLMTDRELNKGAAADNDSSSYSDMKSLRKTFSGNKKYLNDALEPSLISRETKSQVSSSSARSESDGYVPEFAASKQLFSTTEKASSENQDGVSSHSVRTKKMVPFIDLESGEERVPDAEKVVMIEDSGKNERNEEDTRKSRQTTDVSERKVENNGGEYFNERKRDGRQNKIKNISTLVVTSLSKYYKRRILEKDLFKSLAKSISKKVLQEQPVSYEGRIKDIIRCYFSNGFVCRTSDDINRVNDL
ncbi:uncharacterized protein LOC135686468 [Rhopilema esculentum]|uniref:uncharacterized protein LOC135686468 n=1 Tax=Rhopilema esculentum TaxID=499914 RepID=UPI0031D25D49